MEDDLASEAGQEQDKVGRLSEYQNTTYCDIQNKPSYKQGNPNGQIKGRDN